MLKKLGFYIKENIFSLKRCILDNKIHLYLCLGAFAIGLLIALSKDYSNVSTTNNFVFVIFSGNGSPIPQIIRLILWCGFLYLLWFVTAVHFLSFVIFGYGGIILISYLIFSHAFTGVVINPLSGLIYTILYLIPTLFIGLISHVCALKEIYELLNYNCNRRSIINISFHQKSIRKALTPIWLLCAIFIFLYWLIFYLILIIFI